MSTGLWQLSLVVAGGLIGLCGALFSTLLNAFLAERRAQRERLDRFHELLGKRQAILGTQEGERGISATAAAGVNWLQNGKPSSSQVAFMTGILEKTSEQAEAYIAESERLQRENVEAESKIAELRERLGRMADPEQA